MAGPVAGGAAHREPAGGNPPPASQARLKGCARLRRGGGLIRASRTPSQDLPRTPHGRATTAVTPPTFRRESPTEPAATDRSMAPPAATRTNKGLRATPEGPAAGQARTQHRGTRVARRLSTTHIILHNLHRSPKHTATRATSAAPASTTLLAPRQATTGDLAMAKSPTTATDKRGVTPPKGAHAGSTRRGPGISLHVATQKKQEPRVKVGTRPMAEKRRTHSRRRSGRRRKSKARGIQGIRTLKVAAPRRPGVGRVPRRR